MYWLVGVMVPRGDRCIGKAVGGVWAGLWDVCSGDPCAYCCWGALDPGTANGDCVLLMAALLVKGDGGADVDAVLNGEVVGGENGECVENGDCCCGNGDGSPGVLGDG